MDDQEQKFLYQIALNEIDPAKRGQFQPIERGLMLTLIVLCVFGGMAGIYLLVEKISSLFKGSYEPSN
jgi:hypothetical protein